MGSVFPYMQNTTINLLSFHCNLNLLGLNLLHVSMLENTWDEQRSHRFSADFVFMQ